MLNIVLGKIKKPLNTFLSNPIFFLARQLYRILFIFPYEIIVSAVSFFVLNEKLNDKTPSSHCFFVTSVIYSKENKKVTYGGARSIFTPEERAVQTAHTIETIRQKVPQAKIVLIEGGLRDLSTDLKEKADQYLYLGNNKIVRWAVDSTFKSLGEVSMLLTSLKYLKYSADFYFKISGRYFLNEEFIINNWQTGGFVFLFMQEDYVSTRLYGFRKEMFNSWKYALIKGLPFSFIGYAVENTLAKFVPKKFTRQINKLGVSGLSATVKNDVIKE